MKTTKTFKTFIFATLLGSILALPAVAQPGPGMGGGPGMQGSGPMAGQGMGPGKGHGQGRGHGMRHNQGNTAGWSLMTPEERTAHRDKMRSLKTYDECKLVQTEHHALMLNRAKEKGVTLPEPRLNACDRMKARGILK